MAYGIIGEVDQAREIVPFDVETRLSGAKSFAKNPIIGSPGLNRRGLHAWRVRLADRMARRRRFERLLAPEQHQAFARDG